jgi:hypothetical protein
LQSSDLRKFSIESLLQFNRIQTVGLAATMMRMHTNFYVALWPLYRWLQVLDEVVFCCGGLPSGARGVEVVYGYTTPTAEFL